MNKFGPKTLSAVLAAASAAACSQPGARAGGQDWEGSAGGTRVCVDSSGLRKPDGDCGQTGSPGGGRLWYYYASGAAPSPIGARVAGGSTIPVNGVQYRLATPKVVRGGFGNVAARMFGRMRLGG